MRDQESSGSSLLALQTPPARLFRRFGSGLCVVLQLGAAAAFPAADAVLEAASADAPIHVESPEHECHGHDHLYCQVVRSLSGQAKTAPDATMRLARPILRLRTPEPADRDTHVLFVGSSGPRAPPLI